MASYFLYFVAILVFASYLYVTLRSLFLNNLTPGKWRYSFSFICYRDRYASAHVGVINGGLNYLWSGLSLAENVDG